MRQMEQGVLYGNSGCGFLKILHNERGQGFKTYSSCFHEKNLCSGQMDNFRKIALLESTLSNKFISFFN